MVTLLEYREILAGWFRRYENYISPAVKFVVLLLVMLELSASTGYSKSLSGMLPALIVALLGALIPVNYTAAIILAVACVQLYSLSLETGVVMAVLTLIVLLAYLRFSPKDTWLLILMPLCYRLGIPYVLAIAGGLLFTPFSAVSCGFGLLVSGFIRFTAKNSGQIKANSEAEIIERFRYVLDGLTGEDKMIVMIAALAGTVIVVYVIRRLQIKMAWTIAIGVGAVIGLLILLIGDMKLDAGVSIGGAFVGTIVSVLIALVIQFMMFNLDYSGVESVQFEDDSYYYYVKAVPKVSVSAPVKTVKKINSARNYEDWSEEDDEGFDDEFYPDDNY